MPLKRFLTAIVFLAGTIHCFGQETVEKKHRINDDVTEKFQVLKTNEDVKNGLYIAYYHRPKHLLVRGTYQMDKKSGKWYFFSPLGKLLEMYDYTYGALRFEAQDSPEQSISYLIDQKISDTDRITKPVKIGGRYFGYLPYLGLYKTPFNPYQYNTVGTVAIIELLISPLGRLADYKIHVVSQFMQYDQTTTMDINLLKEEDKQFIPGTFNGEPILSRIVIRCRVTEDGGLDFLYNNAF